MSNREVWYSAGDERVAYRLEGLVLELVVLDLPLGFW